MAATLGRESDSALHILLDAEKDIYLLFLLLFLPLRF